MDELVEEKFSNIRRNLDMFNFDEAENIVVEIEKEIENVSEDRDEILAELYYYQARINFYRKDIDHAISLLSKSKELYRKLGNLEKESLILAYLGDYSLVNGSHSAFQTYIQEAVEKYLLLGEHLNKESLFPDAERSYKIAKQLSYKIEDTSLQSQKVIESLEGIAHSRLLYSKDLSVVANYNAYSSNYVQAQREAWRALTIALDTVPFIVQRYRMQNEGAEEIIADPVLEKFIKEFLEFYPLAHRSLITSSDKEIVPVISLKLDELKKFFLSLTDEIPDSLEDVRIWIDTQKESLRFLIPLNIPSFMFLTPDGRLLYHYTQTFVERPHVDHGSSQHLLAGILTAISSVFHETQILGSGGIREINAVGGTLIIESRPNVMVISICDIVFPEIENMTRNLADHIQHQYGGILARWMGNKQSIANLVSDIQLQLSSFSL